MIAGLTASRRKFALILITLLILIVALGAWRFANAARKPGRFLHPWTIAVDQGGSLYVAEGGSSLRRDKVPPRVYKFNRKGRLVKQWDGLGDKAGRFKNTLIEIAVDTHDDVFVVDGSEILKFDKNGKFIKKWGKSNLLYTYAIAFDKFEHMYFIKEDSVGKFTADGKPLVVWGRRGREEGQFLGLTGITVGTEGRIYVSDAYADNVQVFSSTGRFISRWGGAYKTADFDAKGVFNMPWKLTTDKAGNVYIADSQNYRIQKYSAEGKFLTKWGSYGTGLGQFGGERGEDGPTDVAVDFKTNQVYVADPGNKRIQKFTSDGEFLAEIR